MKDTEDYKGLNDRELTQFVGCCMFYGIIQILNIVL